MPADISPAADRIIDAAEALREGGTVENRRGRRHPYAALVALILLEDGRRRGPLVLRSQDVSVGGLLVLSAEPLPVDARGAIQLVRADGRYAIVGIRVRHCRYAGHLEHRIGLQFTPLPPAFARDTFLDTDGRVIPWDPLLKHNLG